MADTLQSVFDLPDVSFTENDTLEDMVTRMIRNYEDEYERRTEKRLTLYPSHPMRIMIYTAALELFQAEQYVERAGKQDLLKYSYGVFLDHLAASRGVTRLQPAAATVTIRFTLSTVLNYAIGIPAGTRVTNGDAVYFQTIEYTEAASGSTYVDVKAECTEVGIEGNDLVPGQINVLVDALPYIKSVTNTDTSSGGTELETDESLAQRVFLAPSSYSVAGAEDAYVYWTMTYNADIGSVMVISPAPCQVKIYILMVDGSIPQSGVVSGLQEFLSGKKLRPLSDRLEVLTPTVKTFNINLTYYINRSDSASVSTIQAEVESAVSDYVTWQTTDIGKDINPSELIKRVVAAGAKRVVLTSPEFATVADTEVAQLGTKTVTYGGLEDD